MRNSADISYAFKTTGTGNFTEKKSWKTGEELFQTAQQDNLQMPIFFSHAEESSGIVYVGTLTSVEILDGTGKKKTRYAFCDLKRICNPKPLSSLILRSTGRPLSDSYIRPYAICKTPDDFQKWTREEGLPPVPRERKTGVEMFTMGGKKLGFDLTNFWQWSNSNLLDNTARGILAEYVVAKALGISSGTRVEWDAFDLLLSDGRKIEVKSASYIQSWYQEKYSSITFGIGKTRVWDERTNVLSDEMVRRADIYVFCLLDHKVQETIDPLNLSQWTFFILPASVLNDKLGDQKTLSLSRLRKLKPVRAGFDDLAEKIDQIRI